MSRCFFFKQKTAYEMRISDWSSDVCSSDLLRRVPEPVGESVPLADAAGRVLHAPLVATHDQPPFNASAMDGYAMRAADVTEGHRRSVERRVGKGCVSTCKSRWSPSHYTNNIS